jgi:hypothetical protein
MKKIILFTITLLVTLPGVYAVDPISNLKETEPTLVVAKELNHLDHLIHITSENLENQKSLKSLFLDYQQKQLSYLENTQDKEVTLMMVKAAHRLLVAIQANHLMQTFDTEFISQLTFFSQFATKKGIPKT